MKGSYHPQQVPSPGSESDSGDSPIQYTPATTLAADMLRIHSLLNPSVEDYLENMPSSSPPTTSPYTNGQSSQASTPRAETPLTPSSLRAPKAAKDGLFVKGEVMREVNYPAYECDGVSGSLSKEDQAELAAQHQAFRLFPSVRGNGGRIADYPRHIPYASDKKTFSGRTGRPGFDVFQYQLTVPGDTQTRNPHIVMWDYHIGLVRITPFFKACNHTKTMPNKAINSNKGLKDLSHSITGGSLPAQGYWMPYSCARALCLTFCYEIRWALTPIFGPSFIKECLKPDDPGFRQFKIDPEIIRNAALEADHWRAAATNSRSTTPEEALGLKAGKKRVIPRSVPQQSKTPDVGRKELRSRNPKGTFKLGSPFEEGSYASFGYDPEETDQDSPPVSPKTSTRPSPAMGNSSAWTAFNRSYTLSPEAATSSSRPAEQRNQAQQYPSWRAADRVLPTRNAAELNDASGQHERIATPKRGIPSIPSTNGDPYTNPSPGSAGPSRSDGKHSTKTNGATRKRARTNINATPTPPPIASSPAPPPLHQAPTPEPRTLKYTADEFRAARWLMKLHERDAELANRQTKKYSFQ